VAFVGVPDADGPPIFQPIAMRRRPLVVLAAASGEGTVSSASAAMRAANARVSDLLVQVR
jgi:Tfp pilus assembly ATPase PilU